MGELFHLRVCFRKTGRLRYLSHLEVGKACERAIRRARLPYAVSQGFTPRMRISFGPALPVGIGGQREYYDLALTDFVPPTEARTALQAVTAEDLAPQHCAYVSGKEKSLASALTIAVYDLELEGGIPPEQLAGSLKAIVDTGTLSVDHKGKVKVFDLAKTLPKEPELGSQGDRTTIRLTVRMGEQGSLRPDAFVAAALGTEVHAWVTRTDLLIEDEGVWRRPL